jgi:hypothetical protein
MFLRIRRWLALMFVALSLAPALETPIAPTERTMP